MPGIDSLATGLRGTWGWEKGQGGTLMGCGSSSLQTGWEIFQHFNS